jgi:hypothetical protein
MVMRKSSSLKMNGGPVSLVRMLCVAIALAIVAPAVAHADTFLQLKALIESGQYEQARDLASHASPDAATNALNLAFTNALILKVQGKYAEAAKAMRAILSDHPNLTRVRGELADTLMRMGDTEGATFNFQLLADSSVTNSQRSFYDNYLTAIRQKRPWTFDAYVALAPSTNVNNGISGKTVIIGGVPFDASSHAGKSGIGLSSGVAGTYRFDLSPRWALTVGGKADGKFYLDDTFDQLTGSVFSEFSYTTPKWRLGFGVTGDRTWSAWNAYNWDVGPQVSLSRNFGRWGTLIGTAGWKSVTYDSIDAYSGDETDIGLRYLKSLSPSSSFGLGMLYSHVNANTSFNGYERYRPSVEFYKELPGGLLTSFNADYEWRDYASNFPLMGTPREDRQLDLSAAVTFRNWSWRGFAPKIQYTYTRNDSNVALYSYSSQTVGFYLTKKY